MKNILYDIHKTLNDIHSLLYEMSSTTGSSSQLINKPILNKFEVMSILRISDSTYRRYVDKGLLRPMTLSGIDMYYEKDLENALELSRRKGRL